MDETRIESIEELIRILNKLPNNFIFRGHADASWKLESSLERVIGSNWSAEEATRFEEFSIDHFRSKFHLYDRENIEPGSKLAWLSLMQHYGVPTRLLDFTESPYVALYFALEAYAPLKKSDFAIYAIDYSDLMEKSITFIKSKDAGFKETRNSVYSKQDKIFDEIVDRFSYDIIWIAEPKQLNVRLDRQAGSFLLSGNRGIKIEDILHMQIYSETCIRKYVVSHALYQSVFALLRKMNITSKSLYGDLEGLARNIKMQMQIYSI